MKDDYIDDKDFWPRAWKKTKIVLTIGAVLLAIKFAKWAAIIIYTQGF